MPPTSRVLVAEDSAVIQTVLREMLTRWGYGVVPAADGLSAWEVLRGPDPPRLAIVDWMMPRLKGPELCRRLRSESPERRTYVLMLTSRTEGADVVEGFDAGADDYLSKPFHAQELWARLRAGARIVRIQEELTEARESLHRRGFRQTAWVPEALELPRGQPVSVVLVEIDRFPQIVESFGRLAADLVLRECEERIREAEPAAISGRYAGAEFLIVLRGLGRPAAVETAERIRAAVGSRVFSAGASSFPVTCHTGIATREPGGSGEASALLRAADEALVASKAESRERISEALRASTASVAGST